MDFLREVFSSFLCPFCSLRALVDSMQMDLQMANARLYDEMQTPSRDRSPSPARVRETIGLFPQAPARPCFIIRKRLDFPRIPAGRDDVVWPWMTLPVDQGSWVVTCFFWEVSSSAAGALTNQRIACQKTLSLWIAALTASEMNFTFRTYVLHTTKVLLCGGGGGDA